MDDDWGYPYDETEFSIWEYHVQELDGGNHFSDLECLGRFCRSGAAHSAVAASEARVGEYLAPRMLEMTMKSHGDFSWWETTVSHGQSMVNPHVNLWSCRVYRRTC